MTALRKLLAVEKARNVLAECCSTDEILEIRDQAIAVQAYLRSRQASIEAQQDAAEIRLRAERRLGELTRVLPKRTGGDAKRERTKVNGKKKAPPTLEERGINKRDASRWQMLASIPDKRFETYVAEARTKGERITASTPVALERLNKKTELAKKLRKQPLPIPAGKFDVIVADPSWYFEKRFGDTTSRGHPDYPPMMTDEICALPIGEHANRNCVLWLWTTNAHLLSGEALDVVEAWGFEPKTMLTWVKDKMGMGDWLRGKTEHCILAVKGKPIVELTNETTELRGKLREHSRKPDEFYRMVEKLCPGTKLELNARSARKGWQAWGNEVGKFAEE